MESNCLCGKKLKLQSSCCKADMSVDCGIGEGTCHYFCQKCEEACDGVQVECKPEAVKKCTPENHCVCKPAGEKCCGSCINMVNAPDICAKSYCGNSDCPCHNPLPPQQGEKDKADCSCKEESCPQFCDKRHTCKTFSCEKCKPKSPSTWEADIRKITRGEYTTGGSFHGIYQGLCFTYELMSEMESKLATLLADTERTAHTQGWKAAMQVTRGDKNTAFTKCLEGIRNTVLVECIKVSEGWEDPRRLGAHKAFSEVIALLDTKLKNLG